MATVVQFQQRPSYITGLSAAWVENLLRQENQSVNTLWQRNFKNDLVRYLAQPDGDFRKYVLNGLIYTSIDAVNIDLASFSRYCEDQKAKRWLDRHRNENPLPPMPAPTPFNDSACFLEFYFFRLISEVKESIVSELHKIASNSSHAIDEHIRYSLGKLTSEVGKEGSFELIAKNPREKRR